MVVGCQPYAPAAFTPRKYSWYSFLLEAEFDSRTIVWSGVFYINKKSTDTSWDRSSDLPVKVTGFGKFYQRHTSNSLTNQWYVGDRSEASVSEKDNSQCNTELGCNATWHAVHLQISKPYIVSSHTHFVLERRKHKESSCWKRSSTNWKLCGWKVSNLPYITRYLPLLIKVMAIIFVISVFRESINEIIVFFLGC